MHACLLIIPIDTHDQPRSKSSWKSIPSLFAFTITPALIQPCTTQFGDTYNYSYSCSRPSQSCHSAMDPSKLKNKRWTALVPQRQSLHRRIHNNTSTSSKQVHLIGKLPEEAYIHLFTYIGISDIVNLALTCREVHALSLDERVWRRKLGLLNWKGEHPPDARKILDRQQQLEEDESKLNEGRRSGEGRTSLERDAAKKPTPTTTTTSASAAAAATASNSSKRTSLSSSQVIQPSVHPSISTPSQSATSTSAIPSTGPNVEEDDDGFGDFVDFSSDAFTATPNMAASNGTFASNNPSITMNGVNGQFARIDLNVQPLQPTKVNVSNEEKMKKKQQDEDLLMLFDDGAEDDIGLGSATPAASKVSAHSTHKPNVSISSGAHGKVQQSNGQTSSPPSPITTSTTGAAQASPTTFSRDLFIAYFKYLIPYYVSLQYQSTSSLIFTQTHPTPLSDISKSYILKNLSSLLASPQIAPTQYEETRLKTTKRNLKSSIDYFDSYLLNKFEKSNDRRIIANMREAALAYCALHNEDDTNNRARETNAKVNGSGSASASASRTSTADNAIIQIFISKIPLFYDNSWDPLANLT